MKRNPFLDNPMDFDLSRESAFASAQTVLDIARSRFPEIRPDLDLYDLPAKYIAPYVHTIMEWQYCDPQQYASHDVYSCRLEDGDRKYLYRIRMHDGMLSTFDAFRHFDDPSMSIYNRLRYRNEIKTWNYLETQQIAIMTLMRNMHPEIFNYEIVVGSRHPTIPEHSDFMYWCNVFTRAVLLPENKLTQYLKYKFNEANIHRDLDMTKWLVDKRLTDLGPAYMQKLRLERSLVPDREKEYA